MGSCIWIVTADFPRYVENELVENGGDAPMGTDAGLANAMSTPLITSLISLNLLASQFRIRLQAYSAVAWEYRPL